MPQELLLIFLGWLVVIAMPVLIASIIWASNAKRKRVKAARSSSSRRVHSSSYPGRVNGLLSLARIRAR